MFTSTNQQPAELVQHQTSWLLSNQNWIKDQRKDAFIQETAPLLQLHYSSQHQLISGVGGGGAVGSKPYGFELWKIKGQSLSKPSFVLWVLSNRFFKLCPDVLPNTSSHMTRPSQVTGLQGLTG